MEGKRPARKDPFSFARMNFWPNPLLRTQTEEYHPLLSKLEPVGLWMLVNYSDEW